jgi:hypothetical protein
METPQKKLGMKKLNRSPNALDPQQSAGAMTQVNEQQHLRPVSSSDLSRERLMAGASTTTEVLRVILQHDTQHEPMGHCGINE